LFERFQCLYDAGQYQACLPVLEEACKLRDAPRCLYNFALVHHSLFHCVAAVGYYEAFLARDPYDAARDQAISALNELRAFCAEPEAAHVVLPSSPGAIVPLPESAPAAAPLHTAALAAVPLHTAALAAVPRSPLRDDTSPRRVLAFATLGAGAATAIATAVFAAYGQRTESDINERAQQNDRLKDGEAKALERNGQRYNTLAWAFLGSSVALLGTSATLFVLDANATQSLDVSTDGALSVRYRGSF
jgi:hypothetical protein